MFIVVDGIDGAGKTTLIRCLADALKDFSPVVTKEPTNDSPWALAIRDSALHERRTRDEELELFHKDRLFHIDNVIKPALNAGKIVLCDRYVDSTLAFQAYSEGDAEELFGLFVPDILRPDITIILDCPVSVGLSRIKRNRPRFSSFETVSTLEAAKRIYDSRRGPGYAHIDASGTAEDTVVAAFNLLSEKFPKLRTALQSYLASMELDAECLARIAQSSA